MGISALDTSTTIIVPITALAVAPHARRCFLDFEFLCSHSTRPAGLARCGAQRTMMRQPLPRDHCIDLAPEDACPAHRTLCSAVACRDAPCHAATKTKTPPQCPHKRKQCCVLALRHSACFLLFFFSFPSFLKFFVC